MNAESKYLPNYGQPPHRKKPSSIDHIYPDPGGDLQILLTVTKAHTSSPRDNHWRISWIVGEEPGVLISRRLEVVEEIGENHLTNWGPLTKVGSPETNSSLVIPVTVLSLDKRQSLENIGAGTPVCRPNGQWNCQDWVITVFERAESDGILTNQEWRSAVKSAREVI